MSALPIWGLLGRVSRDDLWDPDDSLLYLFWGHLFLLLSWLSVYSVLPSVLHISSWGNVIPSQFLIEIITVVLRTVIGWNYISQFPETWIFDTSWMKEWEEQAENFTAWPFHKFCTEHDWIHIYLISETYR